LDVVHHSGVRRDPLSSAIRPSTRFISGFRAQASGSAAFALWFGASASLVEVETMDKRTCLGWKATACVVFSFVAAFLAAPIAKPEWFTGGDKELRAGDYRISRPHSHKNLTIFLIHGKDRSQAKTYLTLQEALEKKSAIVHETNSVNQLDVENTSKDAEVFVQSGEILKGGKQDRIIAFDLILPPKSGKVSVIAFCVDQQRWQQRGQEAIEQFHVSSAQLPTKSLKLIGGGYGQLGGAMAGLANGSQGGQVGNFGALGGAGLGGLGVAGGQFGQLGGGGQFGQQGGVWSEVAAAQKKLRKNSGSKETESSLQLTLEDKKVQEAVEEYVKKLAPLVDGQKDVVGFAFAVNGKVSSAEVYASSEMFNKLWPKLLNAAAAEALAEMRKGDDVPTVTAKEVKARLVDAEQGEQVKKDVSERTRVLMRETKKNILLETRDREEKGEWVHRTYLTK
jgi:hypothetical protein